MTPREFQIEFERSASYIDEVRNGSIRINSEDVNYFLNEAIHVWLTKKLKIPNNEGSGLKTSQKELDEIKDLIVKNQVLVQDIPNSSTEYLVYDLPADYYYTLSSKTKTEYCLKQKTYKNRIYFSEEIDEVLEDTHYGTKYNSPVAEIIAGKIYVYQTSDFSIIASYLDYIKDYDRIDVITGDNTNISPSVHKDIVQIANLIFQSAIKEGRFRESVDKNILTEQINMN